MRKVVWLAGLLALAGCNTPYNPNLLPGALAGNWTGSISSGGTSLGTLNLTLVPGPDVGPPTPGGASGWTMTGTWSMSVAGGTDHGTVSGRGTDSGTVIDFTLKGAIMCSIALNAARSGEGSFFGTYVATTCPLPNNGSFTVSKQ